MSEGGNGFETGGGLGAPAAPEPDSGDEQEREGEEERRRLEEEERRRHEPDEGFETERG